MDGVAGLVRVSVATAHRRFTEWAAADVFGQLHRLLQDILGTTGQIDWSRAAVDSISIRAVKGGPDRPSPVDRGNPARRSTPSPTAADSH